MKKKKMSPPIPPILFLLLLLFVISNGSWDGVIITQSDFQGLQAIKQSLVDPTRRVLSSWNGSDACSGSWVGIKCVLGQVIVIQLPWHGLGGRISDKIGQLRGLRKISIHDNAIGGQIPAALGFLPALRGLYLFNNRFSGAIPPELGNCPVLQAVDLSGNLLSGGIPEGLFVNSSRLYRFHVSWNNLTGPIPTKLVKLASLNFLYLDRNRLTGPIPEFRGGGKLQVLNLDNNSLSGSLPFSLGELPMLKVISVRNNEINGSVPEELGSLPQLQTLDLSSNSIGGRFPTALCNLSSLVEFNLDGNDLEGPLPEEMDGFKNLTRLSLSGNRFNGTIPARIGNVTKLTDLDLSGNNFTGEIPNSLERLVNLNSFNVSNNRLSGLVPPLLASNFNSASFRGNLQLCGYKGAPMCPSPSPSPTMTTGGNAPIKPPGGKPKFNTKEIILIAVGAVLVFLLLLCLVLILCLFNKKRGTTTRAVGEKPAAAAGTEVETGGDAGGKLVHFDGPMAFTADDLLCATAEIMGKSTYGTVYKATLEDGNQVAVKRLREKIAKGQKEFEAEVNVLGKIRHPNLLALRAYYLGPKGEKLLVFDYMPNGSLAAFLHARGPETPIDWATRMSIAMGCARGLHHLHTSESTIHGNMTSTNILLTTATTPVLADFSLYRLMTPSATASVAATAAALGYRAPELTKLKKPTTKSDVYSLGVVLLELLTGKSPGEAMNGVDLPQWVASIVKEEWTNEVFDLELVRDAEAGDELLNTLKLALHCVDPSPAARPEVAEVIRQLEEIKPEVAGRDQEVEAGDGSSSVEKKEEESGSAGGVAGAPATTE